MSEASTANVREGQALTGSLFNEPMRVETARSTGNGAWVVGLVDTRTELYRRVMRVVIEHEKAQGRQVYDVHEKDLGYDITSLDLSSGELRLIEVKGLASATGTILITPNERRVSQDRRDCYWLYIVTNCASDPALQEPIRDPARFSWHEVLRVQHYWLEVNAMTQPMRVREDRPPYGDPEQ